MSAFVVDYKTIDNVLSIRLNHDILLNHCYLESEYEGLFDCARGWIHDKLETLGKEFLRLNVESVVQRYPNDEIIMKKCTKNPHMLKITNLKIPDAALRKQ